MQAGRGCNWPACRREKILAQLSYNFIVLRLQFCLLMQHLPVRNLTGESPLNESESEHE